LSDYAVPVGLQSSVSKDPLNSPWSARRRAPVVTTQAGKDMPFYDAPSPRLGGVLAKSSAYEADSTTQDVPETGT
jgi:hypothetical protein